MPPPPPGPEPVPAGPLSADGVAGGDAAGAPGAVEADASAVTAAGTSAAAGTSTAPGGATACVSGAAAPTHRRRRRACRADAGAPTAPIAAATGPTPATCTSIAPGLPTAAAAGPSVDPASAPGTAPGASAASDSVSSRVDHYDFRQLGAVANFYGCNTAQEFVDMLKRSEKRSSNELSAGVAMAFCPRCNGSAGQIWYQRACQSRSEPRWLCCLCAHQTTQLGHLKVPLEPVTLFTAGEVAAVEKALLAGPMPMRPVEVGDTDYWDALGTPSCTVHGEVQMRQGSVQVPLFCLDKSRRHGRQNHSSAYSGRTRADNEKRLALQAVQQPGVYTQYNPALVDTGSDDLDIAGCVSGLLMRLIEQRAHPFAFGAGAARDGHVLHHRALVLVTPTEIPAPKGADAPEDPAPDVDTQLPDTQLQPSKRQCVGGIARVPHRTAVEVFDALGLREAAERLDKLNLDASLLSTPFHFDYAAAYNALAARARGVVCAVWTCAPPHVFDKLIKELCELLGTTPAEYMHSPQHLTLWQLRQLCERVPELVLLPQSHGGLVYMPAGHMHSVHNLWECMKLAVERFTPMDLPGAVWGRVRKGRCCEGWQKPPQGGGLPAPEYLAVGSEIDRVLVQFAEQASRGCWCP